MGGLGPSGRACGLPHSPAPCLPAGPAAAAASPRRRQPQESSSTHFLLTMGKEQRSCSSKHGQAQGRHSPAAVRAAFAAHKPLKLADLGGPQRRAQQQLLGGLLVLQSWLAWGSSPWAVLPACSPQPCLKTKPVKQQQLRQKCDDWC